MGSKTKTKYKLQVFLVISLLFLLLLFASDSPLDLGHDLSVIICQIAGKYLDFFPLFKEVYFIPNMIIPLLSGFIIDYIGLSYVLVAISCFGLVGQLYMFFYVVYDFMNFEYLFVGRILFCITCETLCVIVFSYTSMWIQGLKIGENFGLLVGINGVEALIFTALNEILFIHENPDLVFENSKPKYKWLFGFNLLFSVIIIIISIYLFMIDRTVESQENKVPVLKQHPDKLLGFWRSLKKCLRQNFILICVSFAIMFSSFKSLRNNLHGVLTFTLWSDQHCDNIQYDQTFFVSLFKSVGPIAMILSCCSDSFSSILPFFIGKYFIQKRKRYLTMLFGSFAMSMSLGLLMSILSKGCADSSIKLFFLVIAVFLCHLSLSCQYVLLYSSVSLMTKQNLIGTRFGIIHALKNFVYFFFSDFDQNLDFARAMDNGTIESSSETFKNLFRRTFGMVAFQIIIYILIIHRMNEKVFKKNAKLSSTNPDEQSTFIKKL